jgi:hypothetical protein
MDSSRSPLARLLDAPHLDRLVAQLAPETLHQLIRQGGLQASGELIALATPAQLTAVLDVDLWSGAQPGLDDRFDPERFGEWLEVLADTGETVAARVVAALDGPLVVAGLSRYIRVFDPSAIAVPAELGDEQPEVGTAHTETFDREIGGYLVRAIRPDAWDAIVSILVVLEADYPERFHATMRACRRLSNSAPEVDGLDNLLTEPEQLLHGVTIDREHRRSLEGYSSPADARAFLEMARQPKRPKREANPIAASYFRAAAADDIRADINREALPLPGSSPEHDRIGPGAEHFDDAALLTEIGLLPAHPLALLAGPRSEPGRFAIIQPLMAYLGDNDEVVYLGRSRELAFLTNTLIAGCSVQLRAFTPQEASAAAVGVCNLGLEHWPSRWPDAESRRAAGASDAAVTLPVRFLIDHDLISAFEVGWTVLHQDVCLFVAEQLVVALRKLRSVDKDIQRDLTALRRELVKQRRAGAPWRARRALDAIATLDVPAWTSLLGLLDECPVLPAALTAILRGHTGTISPTAFEFISTSAQIDQVRTFMAKLPDVLSS